MPVSEVTHLACRKLLPTRFSITGRRNSDTPFGDFCRIAQWTLATPGCTAMAGLSDWQSAR